MLGSSGVCRQPAMNLPEPKSWSSDLEWQTASDDQRTSLIDQLNPINSKRYVGKTTDIRSAHLPFYPDNISILHLTDPNWGNTFQTYYLEDNGSLHWLNGTSPPIHEVNAKAPIALDEANVLAYLRFFFYFVQGSDGPFLIFESPEQPEIPLINAVDDKLELAFHAHPASYNGRDEDGKFWVAAIVWYGNALFEVRCQVHTGGMIEMMEDNLIVNGLETHMTAPLS